MCDFCANLNLQFSKYDKVRCCFFSYRARCIYGVISQGINMGIIAVTLPDMEVRTDSNTAEMSLIFIWIGIGTIVGTLTIGPLYDRVNAILLLSANLLLTGVFTSLAPTWPSLAAYQSLMALMIVFCSAANTG